MGAELAGGGGRKGCKTRDGDAGVAKHSRIVWLITRQPGSTTGMHPFDYLVSPEHVGHQRHHAAVSRHLVANCRAG